MQWHINCAYWTGTGLMPIRVLSQAACKLGHLCKSSGFPSDYWETPSRVLMEVAFHIFTVIRHTKLLPVLAALQPQGKSSRVVGIYLM